MTKHSIPIWPFRFVRAICPDHLYEEIEGDLIQKFNRDVKTFGKRKAGRRLIWNVVRFFRPGIILRNRNTITLISFIMIGNYFKVASRVMLRNKTYSTINVLGLTLGMASAIMLFLWISKEFSYDQFHTDKDRIFTAFNRQMQNGSISCWSTTPRILAPTLVEEYTGIESATSYAAWGSQQLFTVGDTRIVKTSGAYIDPQFLTMFSFHLLKGEASKALDDPTSIVLTENFAKQLFGDKEPFGESLTLEESGYSFPFTVTGILKDLPDNTEFHFDYLISWKFWESVGEKNDFWGNNSVKTYVKLKPGTDVDAFNLIVKNVVAKHYPEEKTREVFLYPFSKMRLYSRFENGVQAGGRIEIIRMLGLLGICLVAIACINFVNLSTARAQKRAREVGIRKVTGAYRFSLIIQFLCEAVLIAFGAGLLSLLVVYLALPAFSSLIQQHLTLDFQNILLLGGILAFIILIGIAAGSYPAFYLSSFQPIRVLKGVVRVSGRGNLRQLLVVFQFGFAVMLIVSVIVIRRQIDHTQKRSAGYDRENLIYQPLTGDLNKNYLTYRNELLSSGIASSVTKTSWSITEHWSNTTGIEWKGKDPLDMTGFERINGDENIATTLGLTILQGRDFDLERFPSDSTAVLLNETAVSVMGFDQPVGEIINDNGIEWQVVGVVKDFILTSPFQKISPIVLLGGKKDMFSGIHIRLNENQPVQKSIASMADLSAKYNPTYPFEYRFIDEEYARKFSDLKGTLTISGLFGSITIFIACLGLFGLSTFMIETRTKEIGIRKVLGSSVSRIIKLLSIDTLKPILIAIALFTPFAWWAMHWWLQSFDYRISLDGWVFLLAGLSIVMIALLTIGLQTYGAARQNPVKSLRSE